LRRWNEGKAGAGLHRRFRRSDVVPAKVGIQPDPASIPTSAAMADMGIPTRNFIAGRPAFRPEKKESRPANAGAHEHRPDQMNRAAPTSISEFMGSGFRRK
jgi:hypothetical protein